LGRGKKLKEVLDSMGMVVAEGVPTALGAYTLARRVNATTPLIDSIYEILYHDLSAKTALRELMTRSAKAEN
jgi:glycerol-3-phosphate dehydrogenase (NAD(P)+)